MLSLFRSKPKHEHYFVRLARLVSPPCDVLDCSCGARKMMLKGGTDTEIPSMRILIDAGSIPAEQTSLGGR